MTRILSRNLTQSLSLRTLLILCLLGGNVVVMVLGGYSLYQSRQQYEQRAQTQTQNISNALDQNISGSIEKIDLALRTVVDEIERQLAGKKGIDEPVINAFLSKHEKRLSEIESIRATNDNGLIILGSLISRKNPVSLSDRNYFIYHRDNINSSLYVAKPVLSRVSNHYVIIASRRINYPDGRFAGVVYANIALDHFTQLLSQYGIGLTGSIILRDADFGLITRFPPIPNQPAGKVGNADVSKEFRQVVASGARFSTYHTAKASDGIERTITFHRMDKAPIISLVGLAREDYLADWNTEVHRTSAMALGFMLLSLLSGGLLLRLIGDARMREQKLSQSDERLNYAQKVARLGSFDWDPGSKKLQWSDEHFRVWGIEPRSVETSVDLFRQGIHPDDVARIEEVLQQALQGNDTYNCVYRVIWPDGSEHFIHGQGEVTFDNNGQALRMIGTVQEITEQKRVEIELAKARDAAEAANFAKSTFLSNMSHELRTPLNAILGFSRMLERDSEMGVESKKKLATINRAGQHLLGLINDVLEISKIEAGRIVIQKAAFDLVELITAVEEIIRVRAEVKGLVFHADHAADLPLYVEGDGPHLKQVLINLLGNAVKYTAQGSVMHRVSRRNGEIVFEISDTGCGISEEDQKRLFQAFYQTDSAISQGEGTGLGLAISLEYTRHMEGKIAVSSQPGKGSTFTLNMPLPETNVSVTKQSRSQVVRLEEGHDNVCVLVVDDKEDNRELAKALLEEAGFDVRTADNGQQAIEAFQSWQPRMILMDMRMPVLDGYQATRQIRGLPGGEQVKIVALTASAFEEDRQRVMDAGCDDMARKPIEEEKLFAVMGEMLALRYRTGEADAHREPELMMTELDLKVLPLEVIKELGTAADALDLASVQQILKQLQESQPKLATGLDSLVQKFRFDQIAELCKEAEESP